MIVHLETEKNAKVLSASGAVQALPTVVSAITLFGGTGATGATAILDNSIAGDGTAVWEIAAPQYGCTSISFPKPKNFSTGCYATLTGTAEKLSVAYS